MLGRGPSSIQRQGDEVGERPMRGEKPRQGVSGSQKSVSRRNQLCPVLLTCLEMGLYHFVATFFLMLHINMNILIEILV